MTLPTSRPFSVTLIDLVLENRHSRATPERAGAAPPTNRINFITFVFCFPLQRPPVSFHCPVSPISFRVFYNTAATPATLSFNWLDLASIIPYTMYLCNDSNFDFKALPNLPFYRIWGLESSKNLTRCKMGISEREYEKIRRFQRSGHRLSLQTFQTVKLRNFEIRELDSSQI